MKEKRTRSRRLGHTRTPYPLPLHSHCFLYSSFCKYPPKPLPSHWFQDQKMRFCRGDLGQKEHERTNRTNNASHEWLPHASRSFWRRKGRGIRIGWSVSARLCRGLSLVCRGLSRSVELSSLTPLTPRRRRMQACSQGGFFRGLSRSVKNQQELSSSCSSYPVEYGCRVSRSSTCRPTGRVPTVASTELSRPRRTGAVNKHFVIPVVADSSVGRN